MNKMTIHRRRADLFLLLLIFLEIYEMGEWDEALSVCFQEQWL